MTTDEIDELLTDTERVRWWALVGDSDRSSAPGTSPAALELLAQVLAETRTGR